MALGWTPEPPVGGTRGSLHPGGPRGRRRDGLAGFAALAAGLGGGGVGAAERPVGDSPTYSRAIRKAVQDGVRAVLAHGGNTAPSGRSRSG
jgi:hypothetical protein